MNTITPSTSSGSDALSLEDFMEDVESVAGSLKGFQALVTRIKGLQTQLQLQEQPSEELQEQKDKLIRQAAMFQAMINENIRACYERSLETGSDLETKRFQINLKKVEVMFLNIGQRFQELN